jgi:predicted enzyme related to lactoylglutathione lyase
VAKDFGLSQIGQIAVPVQDLDRAINFYRDRLGMRFLFQVPNMAFFDCAGVRLMLGLPEGEGTSHPASLIYYRVEDIDAAHAELAGRGIVFESAPHLVAKMAEQELWMAFFPDSEGNTLALMSEIARS